jgi:hypothetical protein
MAVLVSGGCWFGSYTNFAHYMQGEPLVLEEPNKTFLVDDSTHRDFVEFSIRNVGFTTKRVVGCRNTCDLLPVDHPPLVIPPGARRTFRVLVHDRPGDIKEGDAAHVLFWTNVPRQAELQARILLIRK